MIFNLTTPAVSKLPKFTYTGTYETLEDGGGNWRIKFLTSGVLTLTKALTVDVFLVGGGGGARYGNSGGGTSRGGNSGAGGGYTATQKAVELAADSYEIVVGAGGAGSTGEYVTPTAGGTSSAFGYSVDGGAVGNKGGGGSTHGGGGGSGGGASTYIDLSDYSVVGTSGNGGSDGANGGNALNSSGGVLGFGGTGQGTTTREFGESTGDLYAGGGGVGGVGITYAGSTTYRAILYGSAGGAGGGGAGGSLVDGVRTVGGDGVANTGAGGGGGFYQYEASTNGGNGGSGIVIVRNARG